MVYYLLAFKNMEPTTCVAGSS